MFWKMKKIKQRLNQIHQISQDVEQLRYSIGAMEALKVGPGASVREFKVFSQSGEDGVIQWLIHNIPIQNKRFIEFGVQNYTSQIRDFCLCMIIGQASSWTEVKRTWIMSSKIIFAGCMI